jgi:DNA-binding NtrC family response regulator
MSKILYPEQPILLVDDDKKFLDSMEAQLRMNGISNYVSCQDGLAVMSMLKSNKYSLILLDILMPNIKGNELLPVIIENFPDILVILLTAVMDDPIAQKCKKFGAFDYIVKPFKSYELIFSIQNALNYKNALRENSRLRECILSGDLKRPECFEKIITKNEKMLRIFNYIEAIADSDGPVLITGEQGTGKELIALAIHEVSYRAKKGKRICVNVGGLDDTLFSDTLFGHIKGAFNDAIRDRDGMIIGAENGTLFLDEIGDLSMASQVKLLRLIQEGEYYKLGKDIPTKSNARIVVATNQNLKEKIEKKEFRNDLYDRLERHRIHIPPLRDRKEDIPLLVEHFIRKADSKMEEKSIYELKTKLLALFSNHNLEKNIRGVENITYDAVLRYKSGISLDEQFGPERDLKNDKPNFDDFYSSCEDLKKAYDENEKSREDYKARRLSIVREALKRNKIKSAVSNLLDIPRNTIYHILEQKDRIRKKHTK